VTPALMPGFLVTLRSGGPEMTVECIVGDVVACLWFVDGELRNARINAACLVPVHAEEG
jgi:uncharacterized protein YodC (DUF2158 family)